MCIKNLSYFFTCVVYLLRRLALLLEVIPSTYLEGEFFSQLGINPIVKKKVCFSVAECLDLGVYLY